MKKNMFFDFSKRFMAQSHFKSFAFLLLVFFAVQSHFAQNTYTWKGAFSSAFEDVKNWTGCTPAFASTNENFTSNTTAGKISLSGAALAAGKTISNNCDGTAHKAKVAASGSHRLHDVEMMTKK